MRTSMLTLILSAFAVTAAPAADLFAGAWKYVPAKSTNNWGQKPDTSGTRTYIPTANGGYDVKIERVDSDGKAVSNTLKAAGNVEIPIGESPSPVVKMLGATHVISRRVDDHTLVATYLKDGKQIGTSTSKVSSDGRTLTMTLKGKSPDGKELKGTSHFDK
jgi:hypothetical protein